MAVAACALIGYGIAGLAGYFRATKGPSPVISQEITTYTTDHPIETPAPPDSACPASNAPATHPRLIQIPAIGVNACIQKVGIDQKGAIAAPGNVNFAGWYVNSVLPGSPGNSIIDGHVSGRYTPGVFAKLAKLKEGDRIKIQMNDASWREFTVTKTVTVPEKQAIQELLAPAANNRAELSLITCGGSYDTQRNSYADRVIVRAAAAK